MVNAFRYGILGVSLLTALMPRLSRSAARGDYAGVLADLSLGARLSALALLPVSAGLIVLGHAQGNVAVGDAVSVMMFEGATG